MTMDEVIEGSVRRHISKQAAEDIAVLLGAVRVHWGITCDNMIYWICIKKFN